MRRVFRFLAVVAIVTVLCPTAFGIEQPPQYDDPCPYLDPLLFPDCMGSYYYGSGVGVPSGCMVETPYYCNSHCTETNWCSASGYSHHYCKRFPNACVDAENTVCCPN